MTVGDFVLVTMFLVVMGGLGMMYKTMREVEQLLPAPLEAEIHSPPNSDGIPLSAKSTDVH